MLEGASGGIACPTEESCPLINLNLDHFVSNYCLFYIVVEDHKLRLSNADLIMFTNGHFAAF